MDPSLPCDNPVRLTIDVTSSAGPTSFVIRHPTGGPSGLSTLYNATDVPKAIPDNDATGVTSNLPIADGGTVSDIDVRIGGIDHGFVSDLEIDLISPAGTTVRIFNRHGGEGDNIVGTRFDDGAAVSIVGTQAPFTGSFRPFRPLSAFDGQSATGTWRLVVRDREFLEAGTLNGWRLDVGGIACE